MKENKTKKLYRSRKSKTLFGVSGGLGEYLGVDPVLIRIIFLFLVLVKGLGIFLYLFLALIIPLRPEKKKKTSLLDTEKAQSLIEQLGKKDSF